MRVHPIVFAVPLYAVLIGVELWLTRQREPEVYDIPELLANVASGLGQLVTDIFLGLFYVVPYGFLLRYSLHSFGARDPLAWLIGFIGVDFAFYWQHRVSHRVNLLWAAHVVHHQPHRYNLSVALRQPLFSVLSNWVYYQPLALLGVPVDVIVGCVALNLLYQFYLHTSLIDRMGAVELVLNTPSHHRVHHGRNEHYLDRNFAGVFIIWDRLFGTFQAEDARVEFGTSAPFTSLNGIWANFDYLAALWARSRRETTLRSALYVWFAPPEWHGHDEVPPLPLPLTRARKPANSAVVYAACSTFLAVVAAAALLNAQSSVASWQRLLGILLVVWTLAVTGGMLDGRRWAKRAELFRLAALAISALWLWMAARRS